jgi:hypothetical protein
VTRARTWGAAVVAIAAVAALAVVATRGGPGSGRSGEQGLRLEQPGSRSDRGVPLHLALMASRVEGLRGLRFVRPPRVRAISAAELAAFGRRLGQASSRRGSRAPQRLRRPRRLERARIGFEQLAGMLPEQPGSDATAPGSIEGIDAAYDYVHKRILLVQGAIETRRELQLVLAHELTHALEDQHLPLRLGASIGLTERAQSHRALIEGTATFVAARYASRYLSDQVPVEQRLAGQRSVFAAGGSTPYAVKAANIFDYVDGALFVRGLYRDGWGTVNRAIRRPPTSTQQVLHPRSLRRTSPPQPLHLDLRRLLGGDWHLVGGGPAGEQDVLAILGQGAFGVEIDEAGAGWAGGRFELWRAGDDPAGCEDCAESEIGAVAFRWRHRLDAWEFGRAFFAYMVAGRLGERNGPRSWELSDGFASLGSTPRSSAIAFAPTEELARSVARTSARQAAGRSAGAQRQGHPRRIG